MLVETEFAVEIEDMDSNFLFVFERLAGEFSPVAVSLCLDEDNLASIFFCL